MAEHTFDKILPPLDTDENEEVHLMGRFTNILVAADDKTDENKN